MFGSAFVTKCDGVGGHRDSNESARTHFKCMYLIPAIDLQPVQGVTRP